MFRYVSVAFAVLLVAGCALFGSSSPTREGGLVVGDEPYAVRAGAAILAAGGDAADAAVATYFALSATYPVAAGLGGGGLCIVRDAESDRAEEIDFLARDTAHGGAYAVPGNPAGMALLQSRHGKLPWQRVVAAGENLAGSGFPISHALAERLAQNQDVIRLDAGLASEFLDESGHVKAEGAVVTAPALAQTLSVIRNLGPAGFYGGSVAQDLVAYSASQGGAISAADLEDYAAGRGAPSQIPVGDETVLLPSRNVGAGAFISAFLTRLVDAQGNVRGGTMAGVTKAAMEEFHLDSVPRDLGATGFAASDASGQAVACAVTMNGPFGSGRTADGTGVTLARAPSADKEGLAAAFLTPAIVQNSAGVLLVGAGAGGPNGSAAIVSAMLKLATGTDVTQPGQLGSTGIAPYDTVNVIACQQEICATIPDPGGHGLGAAAPSPD